MKIGTGVEFNFGGFRVKFDDKNNQLNLCGGCFTDTLLLENCDCPVAVASGTALQANTLIVKKVIFKNEGVLETFVTILQECPMIENKGKFHADNLFLFKADIQNYDMVQWNDAFKAVGGVVIKSDTTLNFSPRFLLCHKRRFGGSGIRHDTEPGRIKQSFVRRLFL